MTKADALMCARNALADDPGEMDEEWLAELLAEYGRRCAQQAIEAAALAAEKHARMVGIYVVPQSVGDVIRKLAE
jgi:hypothetical protein